jgi:acyl transferase domain-containing protein
MARDIPITDANGWITAETAGNFQSMAPNAKLPWRFGDELEREAELIFDATGRHLVTVDEFKQFPETEAASVAQMIVVAVNTAGGFRSNLRQLDGGGVEIDWTPVAAPRQSPDWIDFGRLTGSVIDAYTRAPNDEAEKVQAVRASIMLELQGAIQAEAIKRAAEDALIEAVLTWAAGCEGIPAFPNDAHLLKAVCTYEGDQTEPCPECDGDCGEPCAPYTVAQAHAMLDAFVANWNREHGIRSAAEGASDV